MNDDEKEVTIDHRLYPRNVKRKYDHERTRRNLTQDYLHEDLPDINYTFNGSDFKEQFMISRPRFEQIAQRLAARSSFYTESVDACGERGSSPQAKILIALKVLGTGTAVNRWRDYFQMSKTLARDSFTTFILNFRMEYDSEYLHFPTIHDIRRILKLHEKVHKVPGMLGCLDVSQLGWRNCPKALQGSFKGKEKKPTVGLETVADYNMYIWHASVGYPGAMNDINVLHRSSLIEKLTETLPLIEEQLLESCELPFTISEEKFDKCFLFTDGIYPSYSRFLKTMMIPMRTKHKFFCGFQESARKDIERTFGQLKQTTKCIVYMNPILFTILCDMVLSCVIIHNMRREEYVSGFGNRYKADDILSTLPDNIPLVTDDPIERDNDEDIQQWLASFAAEWIALDDPVENNRLQKAVIEHVWSKRRQI